MSRFYFNFANGKRIYADSTGKECLDITSARMEATGAARRLMARPSPRSRPNWSKWTVVVLNANAEEVTRIAFPRTNDVISAPHAISGGEVRSVEFNRS